MICHERNSGGHCQLTAPCIDRCPHEVPGFDWQRREIACAGPYVYRFGEWFREDLDRLSKDNPGKPVKLVCEKTGIAFAGLVPNQR